MTANERPTTAELEQVGDEIARLQTAIDQASHRQLSLLREFDVGGGWACAGATSCAAWLSWRTGLTPGPARERVRVAHKLDELPVIDAAFAAGELSYSKVRALARVADVDSEALLVEQARLMTGAQLEKLVAGLRRARMFQSDGDNSETVAPERHCRQRTTDKSMVQITFQLTAEEAAVVTAALDRVAERRGRRAEALVAMADEILRGDAADRSPTEVIVHVEVGALEDQPAGMTDSGELLSTETCRRLLCDAGVVPVLEDGEGRVLDVGRKTRTVPTTIRRALAMRDGGCKFPGCENQIVDAHHVEHWVNGGATSLENLVSLCRRHHGFVHEGGATVAVSGGGLEFRDLRGDVISTAPDRPAAAPMLTDNIDPWRGCARNGDPGPADWPYIFDVVSSALG